MECAGRDRTLDTNDDDDDDDDDAAADAMMMQWQQNHCGLPVGHNCDAERAHANAVLWIEVASYPSERQHQHRRGIASIGGPHLVRCTQTAQRCGDVRRDTKR